MSSKKVGKVRRTILFFFRFFESISCVEAIEQRKRALWNIKGIISRAKNMLVGGSSQEMEGIEVWALFSVAIEGQWKHLTFGERSKVSGDVMQILEPKMILILGAVGVSKKVNEQK